MFFTVNRTALVLSFQDGYRLPYPQDFPNRRILIAIGKIQHLHLNYPQIARTHMRGRIYNEMGSVGPQDLRLYLHTSEMRAFQWHI